MSAPITTAEEAADALASARGVLLDWDGCLAFGDRMPDDACAFLHAHGDRSAVVSNNSTDLPQDLARILDDHGVNFPARRIVLAGCETVRLVGKRARGARLMLIANERQRAYARDIGLTFVRGDADVVALLRDPQFSYPKLARAAESLAAGADLIVSNADASHPGRDGLVPETGALLAALRTASGIADDRIELIGKPERRLLDLGSQALDVAANECVMIGDNPDTDGEGARASGMPFILVGPRSGLTLSMLASAPALPASAPRRAAR